MTINEPGSKHKNEDGLHGSTKRLSSRLGKTLKVAYVFQATSVRGRLLLRQILSQSLPASLKI